MAGQIRSGQERSLWQPLGFDKEIEAFLQSESYKKNNTMQWYREKVQCQMKDGSNFSSFLFLF